MPSFRPLSGWRRRRIEARTVHCTTKNACRRASLPVPLSESTAFGGPMDECTKSLGELNMQVGVGALLSECALYIEKTEAIACSYSLACTSKLPSLSHIEDALHYAALHGYRRMNKEDERHLVATINEAKAANKMRGRVLFFFTTPLAQVRAAAWPAQEYWYPWRLGHTQSEGRSTIVCGVRIPNIVTMHWSVVGLSSKGASVIWY